MGWEVRSETRLDHRGLLGGCLRRRVSALKLQDQARHDRILHSSSIFFIYHLIRRPRMILDFVLTLMFNHLVLTTYYSKSLPMSWFFWLVMAVCAAAMVLVAEQLCVKREMAEGLVVAPADGDEVEMGGLLRRD